MVKPPNFHVLEMRYHPDGRYAGMIVVLKETLTPEFLDMLKNDTDDVHKWKVHRKAMKDLGYDIGEVEA